MPTLPAPKKATPPTPKGAPKPKTPVVREVKYPEPIVMMTIGEHAIGSDLAKDLIGWTETEGQDSILKDKYNKRIRCVHNVRNRPLYSSVYETLTQEILHRRWNFNGEPIILGKTGIVQNGQHTLIAVILAEQVRSITPTDYPAWIGPVTIDKIIVAGIEETDQVVNTMDTCKPRTLQDVIYRSEYFSDPSIKTSDRRTLSRLSESAVKLMWVRTGSEELCNAHFRTHAESIAFIEKHKSLLRAVKHIFEENSDNKVGNYLSPGFSSAVLYLMAACASEAELYKANPTEESLNLEWWDKATEFWTYLAANSEDFHEVRQAIRGLDAENGEAKGSLAEKLAVIAKAWWEFIHARELSKEALQLDYVAGADGVMSLKEQGYFGGIDLPPTSSEAANPEAPEAEPATEPDPDEVKKAADQERRRRAEIAATKITQMRNDKRAQGEVPAPESIQYDKNGKPPIPKGILGTPSTPPPEVEAPPVEPETPPVEDPKPTPIPKPKPTPKKKDTPTPVPAKKPTPQPKKKAKK